MQLDAAEALGLVAGAIGAFAFMPQAVKILRTRDASGVSALTYTMVLAGATLWGVYGWMREAPAIILWNAVAAGLALLVLSLKIGGAKRAD
jgi:MtN3 and saliva related transmembrane protein